MTTLIAILEERLRMALAEFPAIKPQVTPTADARFGDYQTNVAMLLAKEQRANPRQIAASIIERLDVAGISEKPEIAGAGFINFRLTNAYLTQRAETLAQDEMLGVRRAEPRKRI